MVINDKELFDNIIEKENRIKELKETNKYDKKVLDFYRNGIIIIYKKEIPITKINVIGDENNNYFIDIVDNNFILKDGITIKSVTKFRDTTLFQIFIEKYLNNIIDNKITLNEEMIKEFLSMKWDGKYHTLVPEAEYLNELQNKNSN